MHSRDISYQVFSFRILACKFVYNGISTLETLGKLNVIIFLINVPFKPCLKSVDHVAVRSPPPIH